MCHFDGIILRKWANVVAQFYEQACAVVSLRRVGSASDEERRAGSASVRSGDLFKEMGGWLG